jgi:hypothetical protein
MENWESLTRHVRDMASILPVAAIVLFLPPMILVFSAPVLVAGVPLIVLYLYGVWAGIILVALLVARRLEDADEEAQDSADNEP